MKSNLQFIAILLGIICCPACFLLTVNLDAATLDCQRIESDEIHCTRTLWTLRIIPYERTVINNLRGAELTKDDCSDGCYYRVALNSDNVYTLAPVAASWSHDREAKQELADQINAFVEDTSAATLSITEGIAVMSYGGLLILCGAWVVAISLVIFFRNVFRPKRR